MAALKLRRILSSPKVRELLAVMKPALGTTWLEVLDARETRVWGDCPDGAVASVEARLEHDGQMLGTLRGDAKARPVVDLLQYVLGEEANKKALAGEVLDAYREITLLYKLSERLTDATKRQQVLEAALEESNRLIEGTACVVLVAESGDAQASAGTRDQIDELVRIGRKTLELGARKGDIVNELARDDRFARDDLTTRAVVWAPLQATERTLGLIVIGTTDERRDYSAADLSLLSTIASQAGPAYDNATLYENLERIVIERTSELSRAKEEAETANRAKNLFLASMSHELRTPLNALLGYAQILKRDSGLSRKQFEGIDVIQRSGEHLLTLINDILDLSRIEAGRVDLSVEAFDLASLLEDVRAMFRVRAEQSGLEFASSIADDVPTRVEGDAKCLRQILTNLLSNAVKFTSEGSVGLHVHRQGERVAFVVEDTGTGIAKSDLESIFESFRQAGTAERKAEGTGLGLAISKQLAELMGGIIDVESTVGEGSRFTLELLLPPVAHHLESRDNRNIIGYEGPRLRVLVADDDEASRGVMTQLLEPLGMVILEARDGRDAVSIAQAERLDLVLMDLVMPELGGFEAIERIREMPATRDVPIIALSASVGSLDRARSKDCGANDFVAKPVRAQQLFSVIQHHLNLVWIYAEPGSVTGKFRVRPAEPVRPEPLEPSAMQSLSTFAQQGNITGILETLHEVDVAGSPGREAFVAEVERLTRAFALRPLREFLASVGGDG
jgi:signal transduction histidine kinase/CheY-like chemotaxis protein